MAIGAPTPGSMPPFPGKPRPWGPTRGPSTRPAHLGTPTVPISMIAPAPAPAPAPALPPIVAMDCEMVMVGARHELAEVAIVDYLGRELLHEYVRPSGPVTNYLTEYSGIKPGDLDGAKSFTNVRGRVLDILKDKEIVGHALENDFKALRISAHEYTIYDSAHSAKFMKPGPHGPQSDNLKHLALVYLNRDIQEEVHSGLEDARACMDLYRLFSVFYDKREKAKTGGSRSRKNRRPKKRQTWRRNVSRKW
jgi:RNA exonuclease 4